MSNHPLGPWSETLVNTLLPITGGSLWSRQFLSGVEYTATEFPYISTTIGLSDVRTGYNSGGALPRVPRPASRTLVDFKAGEWSAIVDYYDQLISTKKYTRTYTAKATVLPVLFTPKFNANQLISKAFAAFVEKSNDSQFTGLAFAGEFKSFRNDVHFLTNAIMGRHNKAYKDLVKNLLKLKKKSAKNVLQAASDHWLQVQFGLLPDIHDLTALVRQFDNVEKHKTLSTKVTGKFIDESTDSTVSTNHDKWNVFNIRSTNIANFNYVGKVGASLQTAFQSTQPSLSQRFGVGFEDVVPALWELLPYSWLVDYFTNIGDFVNLLSLRHGRFTDGWNLSIIEQNVECTVEPISPVVGDSSTRRMFSRTSGTSRVRSFAFNRNPLVVDTFMPTFTFESPNLKQTANIAAVAVSVLSGRRMSYASGNVLSLE